MCKIRKALLLCFAAMFFWTAGCISKEGQQEIASTPTPVLETSTPATETPTPQDTAPKRVLTIDPSQIVGDNPEVRMEALVVLINRVAAEFADLSAWIENETQPFSALLESEASPAQVTGYYYGLMVYESHYQSLKTTNELVQEATTLIKQTMFYTAKSIVQTEQRNEILLVVALPKDNLGTVFYAPEHRLADMRNSTLEKALDNVDRYPFTLTDLLPPP